MLFTWHKDITWEFLTHTNSYGSHFTFQSDFSSFSSPLNDLAAAAAAEGTTMSILREYLLYIECISKLLLTLGHSFRHSLPSPIPYSAAAVFYISYSNNDFSQRLTQALVDFEGIDGALRNNLISLHFDLLSNSRVTRYFCLDLVF